MSVEKSGQCPTFSTSVYFSCTIGLRGFFKNFGNRLLNGGVVVTPPFFSPKKTTKNYPKTKHLAEKKIWGVAPHPSLPDGTSRSVLSCRLFNLSIKSLISKGKPYGCKHPCLTFLIDFTIEPTGVNAQLSSLSHYFSLNLLRL